LLIGFVTNHSYVVVPSPFLRVLRRRPLETFTMGSGTVMATRWLSGSSACVSLLGHQALAPSPCTAVATQGAPVLSRPHTNPPSHGALRRARGRPVEVHVDRLPLPTRCGDWSVTKKAFPSRR
jgi:hypothetical protein